MISSQERRTLYAEIGQIKARIEQIKEKLNENWHEDAELRDAQREHRREARKPHMRGVGYQGGDCDRRRTVIQSENFNLREEMSNLYVRKNALYEKLQGK